MDYAADWTKTCPISFIVVLTRVAQVHRVMSPCGVSTPHMAGWGSPAWLAPWSHTTRGREGGGADWWVRTRTAGHSDTWARHRPTWWHIPIVSFRMVWVRLHLLVAWGNVTDRKVNVLLSHLGFLSRNAKGCWLQNENLTVSGWLGHSCLSEV